jgi:hypothetical protein
VPLLRARAVTAEAATPEAGTKIAGAAATIAATGALACGVCCVLPFALPAAILALSGGVFAWFGRLTPWVTAIAFVAVAAGWLWVGRQTFRTRRRPARSTLLTMTAATVLLAAALAWPHFEGSILALVRR